MLVVVRHGQTAVNAEGRLQGRSDAPLTDLGRAQAAAVASVVDRPAIVVSSPLLRARQTAEAFGVPVTVDERWIELDYGELDGAELRSLSVEVWDAWRRDPAFALPGGESLVALGDRVRDACEEIATRAADETVVVVSHVSPVKAAVAWALGVGDEVAWRMFLDLAAVTRIAIGPRGPSLVSFNERAHLPPSTP